MQRYYYNRWIGVVHVRVFVSVFRIYDYRRYVEMMPSQSLDQRENNSSVVCTMHRERYEAPSVGECSRSYYQRRLSDSAGGYELI